MLKHQPISHLPKPSTIDRITWTTTGSYGHVQGGYPTALQVPPAASHSSLGNSGLQAGGAVVTVGCGAVMAVGVGVSIGGRGRAVISASYAPKSQAAPWGRGSPLWSTSTGTKEPKGRQESDASAAGLKDGISCVRVGPPFNAKGSSMGSAVIEKPQLPSLSRLASNCWFEPWQSMGVFPDTIEFAIWARPESTTNPAPLLAVFSAMVTKENVAAEDES